MSKEVKRFGELEELGYSEMVRTITTPFLLALIILVTCSCAKNELKKNGCVSSSKDWWDGSCGYTVGNIFTPDGNGLNDRFMVFSICEFTDFNMIISKKNKTLYITTDPTTGWDGTIEGKEAKEGLYDYDISGEINGHLFSESGAVTLSRDGENNTINSCFNCVPVETYSETFCQSP